MKERKIIKVLLHAPYVKNPFWGKPIIYKLV